MSSKRYDYIDNIKFFVIILVVMVHANVTYGNIGGWYYIEKVDLDIISKIFSGLFGAFNQAFFMGIMFLFAGYFTPSSYDKKGLKKFSFDKLIRLGIPVLIYVYIINPINLVILEKYINKAVFTWSTFIEEYIKYSKNIIYTGGTGPLWFAQTLLVFSLMYGFLRKIGINDKIFMVIPSNKKIVQYIGIISIFVFLVRIWQPIGKSIFNLQFCFFVLYIVLFNIGIVASRNDWFNKWEYNKGKKWLKYSFRLGIPLFFIVMLIGGALKDTELIMGGFRWQSLMYSTWETFVGISMCIGITVVFREKFNYKNRLMEFLTLNTFGIYVFHPPILLSISAILRNFNYHPAIKFCIASIFTIFFSIIISNFIRKIPKIGEIFC